MIVRAKFTDGTIVHQEKGWSVFGPAAADKQIPRYAERHDKLDGAQCVDSKKTGPRVP